MRTFYKLAVTMQDYVILRAEPWLSALVNKSSCASGGAGDLKY